MDSWLDYPQRGQLALTILVFLLAAAGVWIGRRRPMTMVPWLVAFLFCSAVAIPSVLPARPAAFRQACVANLQTLQRIKADWAMVNHKGPTAIPTKADLRGTNGTFIGFRSLPLCPAGGTYSLGPVQEFPSCTLSNRGHRLRLRLRFPQRGPS